MTRHNHRNCLVTVHYERTQNKLRHMDLRWKRAGREMRKKRCEREKERRERENEFVDSVWLLKRRRTVPRVARGPRSRYAHVIKRIKGTPRPSGSPVHPRKPGAQRYGEPWLTFRHSLRAPFIRHSFASTRITCTPARASSCVCACEPTKSRISRPNERGWSTILRTTLRKTIRALCHAILETVQVIV